jgi:hypothetical protein
MATILVSKSFILRKTTRVSPANIQKPQGKQTEAYVSNKTMPVWIN